jgi:hypothetical protein
LSTLSAAFWSAASAVTFCFHLLHYRLPNKPELPGFLLIDPPFAAKVLTIVGLPPTPCRLDLFLLTALDFSPAVMLAAFAAGTHFGYDLPLFFDALFRPHS